MHIVIKKEEALAKYEHRIHIQMQSDGRTFDNGTSFTSLWLDEPQAHELLEKLAKALGKRVVTNAGGGGGGLQIFWNGDKGEKEKEEYCGEILPTPTSLESEDSGPTWCAEKKPCRLGHIDENHKAGVFSCAKRKWDNLGKHGIV